MSACTCDFEQACNNSGMLHCRGCDGGGTCICPCGGELECGGCLFCDHTGEYELEDEPAPAETKETDE